MKFHASVDISKESFSQDVIIVLGDHFNSKAELSNDLSNEEVSETIEFDNLCCRHNEIQIENSKLICKCGKEWIPVPDVNETEEQFIGQIHLLQRRPELSTKVPKL